MEVRDLDRMIEAVAFRALLSTRAPVPMDTLVAALGMDGTAVRRATAAIADAGHLRLADGGDVVGSAGLSVVPSRHELIVDGDRFWTWCAYDAVGILAALGASGLVQSRDPHSGRAVQVAFREGQPGASPAVIFMVELPAYTSAHDEWCPLVNLFESDASAREWAVATGLAGSVLTVAEAASRGAKRWGPLAPTSGSTR
jgi:alkylmercury lyase